MPNWIRNIHETWANGRGWRTDIDLAVLNGAFYHTAEFLLDDGTAICIPMSEMVRVLLKTNPAPVRPNLKVGPFNVNPFNSTVHDCKVEMRITHRR